MPPTSFARRSPRSPRAAPNRRPANCRRSNQSIRRSLSRMSVELSSGPPAMIQHTLARILTDAARAAAPELGLDAEDLPTPELSRPRVKEHGDWSTNLALVVASKAGA